MPPRKQMACLPRWKNAETFVVTDANGTKVAWVHHREAASRYHLGALGLSFDEARRIANAIARLPEFLKQRRGFFQRGGGGYQWKLSRPYHVALEDTYLRTHWGEIDALCRLNSLPFNPTGEIIQNGGAWRVHEFAQQMDAILLWDRFEGRWLVGEEFHYPERPANLPELKPLKNWRKPNPRDFR